MSTGSGICYTVFTQVREVSPTPSAGLSIGHLDSTARSCIIPLFNRFDSMSVKLMKELLRRGKTGNEIIKILDAVVGDGKLSADTNAIVLDKQSTAASYSVSEPPMFWSLVIFITNSFITLCVTHCISYNTNSTATGIHSQRTQLHTWKLARDYNSIAITSTSLTPTASAL